MALQSQTAETYDKKAQESGELQPYYVENVKITSAKDVSGVDGEYHFERDTAILLSLDIGKDFEPELFIGGDFRIDWDNYDGSGDPTRIKPLEWGSNFKVDELAARAGLSPLFAQDRDDNVIRDEVLEGLLGAEIVYLRYAYGNKKGTTDVGYTTYDRVRFPENFVDDAVAALEQGGADNPDREAVREKAIELAKDELAEAFEMDSYVKDYDPGVVEAVKNGTSNDGPDDPGDFSSPTGGSSKPRTSGWDDSNTFEPDDDLPF